MPPKKEGKKSGQPLWYKDAVIYELHVRAFHDGNGDGVGDFQGLIQKLDYLEDLGVTAIWLLPFYPSPLRDDGYDIENFTNVHPEYGTLHDFKLFLKESHKRGIKVITELVLNHTSDQHPWFQRARKAKPGSKDRNYYIWSDTGHEFEDARVIFKDFESSNWAWDPEAGAYYWHRFYTHQPDLNYENPRVHKELLDIIDFWLDLGVDGLRLDAVAYLYQREGTNCENLPENHKFLKKVRRHVEEKFGERLLIAEADQWPEDTVKYFGDSDECQMCFNFPMMPRLFMALHMEDQFPLTDILAQTPPIPDDCQWAHFLRNHDELTLEMVTDEERDYMFRMYANDERMRIHKGIRRRLAPLLHNNRRRIELLNGLLFSLPGTPVLYYGDEIGMGDNIYLGDRNSVRTPMQWSSDRNGGFSRANPQRLYAPVNIDPEYHYESINVEAQRDNMQSPYWWMKRVIALRKQYPAFGRGSMQIVDTGNNKVFAFLRKYKDENVLVVANLSRFVQYAEVTSDELKGAVPVELFGHTEFPRIAECPLFVTLGPHAFYWFSLQHETEEQPISAQEITDLPVIEVRAKAAALFGEEMRPNLEKVLLPYIKPRRWFGGKGRKIKRLTIYEALPVKTRSWQSYMVLLHVDYTEGEADIYTLPLALCKGDKARQIEDSYRAACIARISAQDSEYLLHDATADEEFCRALLGMIEAKRQIKSSNANLKGLRTTPYKKLRGEEKELTPRLSRAEQSNTSIILGNKLILKLFRRLDPGLNPDLEIGRFLTEKTKFENIAAVAGSIEYSRKRRPEMAVCILQDFVPNQGDAWQFTLSNLERYLEKVLSYQEALHAEPGTIESPPEIESELLHYLDRAALLGKRTAEMHVALASGKEEEFASEPFTQLYSRSVYQNLRNRVNQMSALLSKKIRDLPSENRKDAEFVLKSEATLLKRFGGLMGKKFNTRRTRIHGDYHLGQVLYTGRDFIIIDFEGEPARSLSERRIKRSPLVDVAGMLRSFHYAAYASLFEQSARGMVLGGENVRALENWALHWHAQVRRSYLDAYIAVEETREFLPKRDENFTLLLDAFILDKALYELGYEINSRPGWVRIPLQAILQLIKGDELE